MEKMNIRYLATIGVTAGSVALLGLSGKQEAQYEKVTEACVSELVGRPVNLVSDGAGGLQHPESVLNEQRACEQYNNDPIAAANR